VRGVVWARLLGPEDEYADAATGDEVTDAMMEAQLEIEMAPLGASADGRAVPLFERLTFIDALKKGLPVRMGAPAERKQQGEEEEEEEEEEESS
jgi:hypothetical protein